MNTSAIWLAVELPPEATGKNLWLIPAAGGKSPGFQPATGVRKAFPQGAAVAIAAGNMFSILLFMVHAFSLMQAEE